jgi:hypothetical protein
VDEEKCQRYIGHMTKVIPKVIEMDAAARVLNVWYCLPKMLNSCSDIVWNY